MPIQTLSGDDTNVIPGGSDIDPKDDIVNEIEFSTNNTQDFVSELAEPNFDVSATISTIQKQELVLLSEPTFIDKFSQKTNWTLRKPFSLVTTDSNYEVVVKTKYKTFSSREQLDNYKKEAVLKAFDFLVEHFHLLGDSQRLFENVTANAESWYLEPRPKSKVLFLVLIDRKSFDSMKKPSLARPIILREKNSSNTIEEFRNLSEHEIIVRLEVFQKEIQNIKNKLRELEIFAEQAKLVKLLRIKGHDFYLRHKLLDHLWTEISKLLRLNELRKESYLKEEIHIFISHDYEVLNIVFVEGEVTVLLKTGFNEFLQSDVGKSAQFIAFLVALYAEDKLEKFFLATLDEYLYGFVRPRPELDFDLDQKIDVAKNALANAGKNILRKSKFTAKSGKSCNGQNLFSVNQPPDYAKNAQEMFDSVMSNANKIKAAFDRGAGIDFVADGILENLPELVVDIDSLLEFDLNLTSKIDLVQILSDLMNCIPDFCFDLNIAWPKLPKIPKFPSLDFLLTIRIELEKVVFGIILDLVKSLVLNIVLSIPRFCQDGSTLNLPSDFGLVKITDYVPDIADVVRVGTPPNKVGCPDRDFQDFLDELSKNLTPAQICSLLNGRPSDAVLDIIEDVLEDFPCLRDSLNSQEDWIRFFKSIGDVIGQKNINDICSIAEGITFGFDPFDCNFGSALLDVQNQVYQMKTGLGEGIPEEFIAEQLALADELKKNMMDMIADLSKTNELESNITSAIQNLAIDTGNSDQKTLTDLVVEGIFSYSMRDVFDDISNYNFKLNKIVAVNGGFAGTVILGEPGTQPTTLPGYRRAFHPIVGEEFFGDTDAKDIFDKILTSSVFSNSNAFYGSLKLDLYDEFVAKESELKKSLNSVSIGSFKESGSNMEVQSNEVLIEKYVQIIILEKMLMLLPIVTVFSPDVVFTEEYLRKNRDEIKNKFLFAAAVGMSNLNASDVTTEIVSDGYLKVANFIFGIMKYPLGTSLVDSEELMQEIVDYNIRKYKEFFAAATPKELSSEDFFKNSKNSLLSAMNGVKGSSKIGKK